MIIFVKNFIDAGASVGKHEHLVKALVDLIQKDQSIPGETEFYIGENGEKIKKVALGDLKKVCLPSFLLGVWHYVVLNRKVTRLAEQPMMSGAVKRPCSEKVHRSHGRRNSRRPDDQLCGYRREG